MHCTIVVVTMSVMVGAAIPVYGTKMSKWDKNIVGEDYCYDHGSDHSFGAAIPMYCIEMKRCNIYKWGKKELLFQLCHLRNHVCVLNVNLMFGWNCCWHKTWVFSKSALLWKYDVVKTWTPGFLMMQMVPRWMQGLLNDMHDCSGMQLPLNF